MSDIDQKTPTPAELTQPRAPTGSPEYLAWAEQKIRKSIAADDAHPERRKSLESVMKIHGVR